MNLDTFALENQASFSTEKDAECAKDQAPEITPMSIESFCLVGGGSGIVLLG